MGADPVDLNTITVAARTMLLTQISGVAVHLTPVAGDGDDAQPAIPSHLRPPTTRRSIDPTAGAEMLRELHWASRTLCGIRWNVMARGDPSGTGTDRAPTCRRCLAIIDRWFPTPVADDRIGLLAVMVGRAVHDYGTAEVVGVPGDQTAALRRAARDELKKRFGYTAKTYVIDDLVVISSSDTTEQLQRETAKQFLHALGAVDEDTAPIDDADWRFHWRAWSMT